MEPPPLRLQEALPDGFPGRTLKLRHVQPQSLTELCAASQQLWPIQVFSWVPAILPSFRPQVVQNHTRHSREASSLSIPKPEQQSPASVEVPPRMKKRWRPSEDQALAAMIAAEGVPTTPLGWRQLGDRLPTKPTARQCKARWVDFLAPGIRSDSWTPEEDEIVLSTQARVGNAWSSILDKLPGRTYASLKNRYNALDTRSWYGTLRFVAAKRDKAEPLESNLPSDERQAQARPS